MSTTYSSAIVYGKQFNRKELIKEVQENGCLHEYNRETNNFCSVCGAKNKVSVTKDIFSDLQECSSEFSYFLPYDTADKCVIGFKLYHMTSYQGANHLIKSLNELENPSSKEIEKMIAFFKEKGFDFQEKDFEKYMIFSIN